MLPGLNGLSRCFFFRLLPVFFTAVISCCAIGQVCRGSLGDPAVNITFGPGGTGSSVVAPGYIFTSSSCPNDGFYAITPTTSNCFGNVWTTVSTDHTGNGGNFMLVNASYTPGDFFVRSVSDLCPNTTYEFAAWIMNVMMPLSSIRPNITFRIESPSGVVLQQFQTGDISIVGQWTQYGFFFTTPPDNASVVLRMTNNAPGGYGNDLALDDITFRPCGPTVQASIDGNDDTVDVCVDDLFSYTFNAAISSGYQLPAYQWQVSTDKGANWKDISGATSLTYHRLPTAAAGIYSYRLTVTDARVAGLTSCRIASNDVVIHVHPRPVVDAGRDRILITGNTITLIGKAEGEDVSYLWTPPAYMNDNTVSNPIVSPPSDLNYTLSAISSYGCTNEDRMLVKVVSGIFVPTAFTPNGDNRNDKWEIPFLDPAFGAEVSVFNRWGQLVYHTTGEVVSWDGTYNAVPQGPGNFVYMIRSKEHNINLKGTVALIR
jgi:gliding motility-associated-like protein